MRIFVFCCTVLFFVSGCSSSKGSKSAPKGNPLNAILKDAKLQTVLSQNDKYEVQIIYTQINRDNNQVPSFTTWHWNVDSTQYFYPASTVKMPLALLALEKINTMKASGYPRLNSETAYTLDSVRPFQHVYSEDVYAPNGKPTIAQDVRAIFAVSDNDAYNHLFDFLGREYINTTLQGKGYENTGIVHRFYAAQRDQKYAQPIRFMDAKGNTILREKEKEDKLIYVNPQKGLKKGKGYLNSKDSLVQGAFDFSAKNWFALTDMERMLRAALFPDLVPSNQRFNISKEDYKMMHRAMGLFPREFTHPKYETTDHWDGYVKFFVMGDTKVEQNGNIRLFNKVGEAYGTLTDVAYVVDYENKVEFVLAATILCNSDGIYNDDKYDYDNIGFPFLSELGKQVLEYERKRVRAVVPDLSYWKL